MNEKQKESKMQQEQEFPAAISIEQETPEKLTLLFYGDSITDCNRNREEDDSFGDGYVNVVAQTLEQVYDEVDWTIINKGIGGNRVVDLLERFDQDVLPFRPDLICLFIGINDVWRRYDNNDPTTVEVFEEQYNTLMKRIDRELPDTAVIIIEPFVLPVPKDRIAWREDLDPKIAAVRRVARDYADYYIALDGLLAQLTVEAFEMEALAPDGVHPSELGHRVIAGEVVDRLSYHFFG